VCAIYEALRGTPAARGKRLLRGSDRNHIYIV